MSRAVKDTVLNVRLEGSVKNEVEQILRPFGITLGDAVNMYFHRIIMDGGIPFELREPRYNAKTIAAMEEGERLLKDDTVHGYSSAKEALNAILAEDDEDA